MSGSESSPIDPFVPRTCPAIVYVVCGSSSNFQTTIESRSVTNSEVGNASSTHITSGPHTTRTPGGVIRFCDFKLTGAPPLLSLGRYVAKSEWDFETVSVVPKIRRVDQPATSRRCSKSQFGFRFRELLDGEDEVILGVSGRNLSADSGFSFRHNRIREANDVDALS